MTKAETILPLLVSAVEAHIRARETADAFCWEISDDDSLSAERAAIEIAFNKWLWVFHAHERPTITLADAEALLAEIALEVTRVQS